MSAFIVSNKHISALVTAGLGGRDGGMSWYWPETNRSTQYQAGEPWGPSTVVIAEETRNVLTRENADTVGKMLLVENYKSVNHRYDENSYDDIPYAFEYVPMNPIDVLSLISGYEYQSCEHPEWKRSEAKKFCDVLRLRVIRKLPGYSNAKWTI